MMNKCVKDTYVIMHELILPNESNALGNVFGGRVMHYMDMCAAMSAYKHARLPVVTASVDRLDFMSPAKVGDILILKSAVNYVSTSSMEVGVKIEAENPLTGSVKHTASAYLTFVGLNDQKKPTRLSKIIPSSDDEKRRYDDGRERHKLRKQRLKERRS